MSRHRVAHATPRTDFTVDIVWTDGSRSIADFRAAIGADGLLAALEEPAIFLRRMYVQANGESIAWEVFGQIVDFHADNLWDDSRARTAAAQ